MSSHLSPRLFPLAFQTPSPVFTGPQAAHHTCYSAYPLHTQHTPIHTKPTYTTLHYHTHTILHTHTTLYTVYHICHTYCTICISHAPHCTPSTSHCTHLTHIIPPYHIYLTAYLILITLHIPLTSITHYTHPYCIHTTYYTHHTVHTSIPYKHTTLILLHRDTTH